MDIFQTITFLYLSDALVSTDCFFNISSLWLLWLLSHTHILSLSFPLFPLSHFPSSFPISLATHSGIFYLSNLIMFVASTTMCTFQTCLSYPYHCLELQAQCPATCWFCFWMFHSYLSFRFFKITLILSHLSISEENAIFLPSKLDVPWFLFSSLIHYFL